MIRRAALFMILWAFTFLCAAYGEETHPTWIPSPEIRAVGPWITMPDDVYLDRVCVASALGRILLIRKGPEYLALRFTNTWLGKEKYEHYTSYEYYYQDDGSGDFSKENVKYGKGEFFYPGRTVFMGHPSYLKGLVRKLRLGKIKIEWSYTTGVFFLGNELAPTPWTSIGEVNLRDPRIKWYRKDSGRQRTTMHIDQLWPPAPGNTKERVGEGHPVSLGPSAPSTERAPMVRD